MTRPIKTFALSSGLLAGVAISAIAAHSLAVAVANRSVAAQIAALPGARAGTVSVDPWHGQVVLGDFVLSGKDIRVQAGRIVLPVPVSGLSLVSPAFALDGAASVDDLVIESGIVSYKIKHLEASGTSLTSADLAAIVDSKSTVSSSDRLKKLTAAAISAPMVAGTIKIGDLNETITYKDVRLANVVAGKIGAASIAETNIAIAGGKAGPIAVMMPNTTAKNIDLVLISRMLTQARTDANEPLATLYESFSADGFTMTGMPNGTMSLGKISGQGFKGRAMAVPYFEIMNKLDKSALDGKQPSPEQKQEFAKAYADLARSIEIGGLEVRDLAVSAKDKGKDGSFQLARYAMNGLAGGKLAEVVYEGLSFSSAEAKFSLANFSLRGFDFRPLLALADAYAEKGEAAMEDPAAIRIFIPTLDHVGFTNLDLDAEAQNGQVGNADGGKRNAFKLGGMALDSAGYIGGVPTSTTLTADHFKMDLGTLLSAPDMKDFAALGYKAIDASSKIDLAWNEATSELALKPLTIDVADMGKLTVTATIANVSKDVFAADSNVALAAGIGALAKKLDISFVNTGIVERALQSQATKAKKSPDDIRKMMIAGAGAVIPAVLGNSQGARDISAAVVKFLATPKSLHVVATSAKGLGVADVGLFSNPQGLLDELQVTATAN